MFLNTRNKILLTILIALIGLLFLSSQNSYKSPVIAQERAQTTLPDIEAKSVDPRAEILADYFAKHNSPLEDQAQNFVDAADTYGVDWKLVPAIAGVESTFGKRSYGYNAWGWGIYGDQALGFRSWKDGIYTVTEGLKKNYIDRGLTNPYTMNRIYAASPAWGGKVTFFMNDLDRFAQKYPEPIKIEDTTTESARESAKLAYK